LRGGLSTFVGTSQATPHAAGAAAVLLEVNPQLTPADIERILESTGKPLLDARNGVTTPRVDVLAAVQAARPAGGGVRRRRSAHP
jgi:serine protease